MTKEIINFDPSGFTTLQLQKMLVKESKMSEKDARWGHFRRSAMHSQLVGIIATELRNRGVEV